MHALDRFAFSDKPADEYLPFVGHIADDTVLLAQHQCFAASAPLLVGTLAQISTIVTDRPPPSPMWAALDRARVRVLIATGEPPNGSADTRFKPSLATSDAFLPDPFHAGRK